MTTRTHMRCNIFHNALIFQDTEQVLNYYTSSLLFKECYDSIEEKNRIVNDMNTEIQKVINLYNKFIIKKEVIGILAFRKD